AYHLVQEVFGLCAVTASLKGGVPAAADGSAGGRALAAGPLFFRGTGPERKFGGKANRTAEAAKHRVVQAVPQQIITQSAGQLAQVIY
ncbi:MAG: hypothetical protein LBP33_01315, partial [Candidatus Adiutrix sp.]|nr:hypothetical protein [Candidatus Adiutrix sp.]